MEAPREFRSTSGVLRIQAITPTVITTVVTGHFDVLLVPPFVRTFDAWSAGRSSLVAFHDWEAMTDYDLATRVDLTRWTLEHRTQFAAIHFLLRSPVVRAGVEIANFALGRFMVTHASRDAFRKSFDAATTPALR